MKKTNTSTVLYIVDSPSECRRMANLLHAKGYAVRTFASAREFMDTDFQRKNACLIIDIDAAGMAIEELKGALANGPALPIILTTLSEDLSASEAVRSLGATAYFRKPIDDHALIDAIEWAILNGVDPVTQ